MKKIIISLLLVLNLTNLSAQDKVGLFKSLNVKTGLTISYFHNFQGEYVYILQQNARVVEHTENKDGATLSIVVLFPFDDDGKFNFLLNVPLLDYKSSAPDPKDNVSLFNSQTPFGVGLAAFPFDKPKFFGFSAMVNIGRQKRMRQTAIDNQFFPISSYPNYSLNVGAPVPEAILDAFLYKATTVSVNAGIIIRL
jgi:hypothetical protein